MYRHVKYTRHDVWFILRLTPGRAVDGVDPGHCFGGFDRGDVEIDHHGFAVAADQGTSCGLALISWWGT
jgi:hypothetical protein